MAKDKYQVFLNKVDELTRIRLDRIDVIFQVNKYKFINEGYSLTELTCEKNNSIIKRNNKGYFAYEGKALNTKEDYEAYQDALAFVKKHKEDFKVIHNLLVEKETILNGLYKTNEDESELNNLVSSLGYGEQRKRDLDSFDGDHPSVEFKNLMNDLNILNRTNDKTIIDEMVKNAFNHVKKAVNEGYRIELKKLNKKYDTDFDNYVGVTLMDPDAGGMSLLYGSDGFEVNQNLSSKSINVDFPFLEVYLKIITMGLLKSQNC